MMTTLGKIDSRALVFEVTKYDRPKLIKLLQQMKRPEIELFQVFSTQDKTALQKSFEKWIKKGQFTVIFVRDK